MKRFFSCILVLSLLFACCGSALAADVEPLASPTITKYTASLSSGNNSGQVKFFYNVSSSASASSIGVSTIKIYKSNGTYVTTITGTTSNGLIASGTNKKVGSYSYSGVSGTSYYAIVTFTATVNGVTDSKTVTTNTATAP